VPFSAPHHVTGIGQTEFNEAPDSPLPVDNTTLARTRM
jgi:hypothetical protein